MRFYAVGTDQILEAALEHLARRGYAQADLDRLARAYEAFQRATQRKIYGSVTFPSLATLRKALETDAKALAAAGLAQTSVSRVRLLPPKPGAPVVRFKLDPLNAPLLRHLDDAFPRLAARP
jgi:hypothetical protein